MADWVQNADGSAAIRNELDGLEIARFGGAKTASAGQASWRATKIAKLALSAIDSGGGVLSWANPEPVAILIDELLIDVITPAAAACAVSFGVTIASAGASSSNLLDSLPVAAAGTFDNFTDKGVNGRTRQKLPVGGWLTGSTASGASAGLSGFAYVQYVVA